MSELLTISPFEHGSYTHVLHVGLTDRLTRINLADPAVCGAFVTVPKHTAFYAYRRVLGIAQAHSDGWCAEDFEVFAGNRDYEVRLNTRCCSQRQVKWVRGRHEGAEYGIEDSGSKSPQVGIIKSYGPHVEPSAPAEVEKLREMFLRDSSAATKLPTQVLCHRIYRQIPPGHLVRIGIKEVVKYHDEPELDKAVQVMHLMSLGDIKNPSAWIANRLRPITQIKV